jgi:hypothetical protein
LQDGYQRASIDSLNETELPEVRLEMEDYTLIITNKFTLAPSASIDSLINTVIVNVEESESCIRIQVSNGLFLTIALSDDAYFGPEALVLHGPDNLCIVWN